MQKKIVLAIVVFLLIGIGVWQLFPSPFSSSFEKKSGKMQVTTSFYPLSFFASEIGKDKAQVSTITPLGVEPHDYEPTAHDIARLTQSDIVIINGSLEPWADTIQHTLSSHTLLITIGSNLLPQSVREKKDKKDPHIWLDPLLAENMVQEIAAVYTKRDPQNKTYYEQNTKGLRAQLVLLDEKYKKGLEHCASRDIITSHAAFGYLAARYQLSQIAVSGLSPEEEPSAKTLAKVSDFAKSNKITTIFFESLVSPKLAETLAREVGATTLVLDPIEGISDTDQRQAKNYFTRMEDNLHNLQIALQCHN